MLCNSGASLSTQLPQDARRRRSLQPRAISPVETQRAREIRAIPAVHNRGGIVQAARWMYAVMEAWKKKLRDYHVPGEASAMMCAKLAALVCNHMRAVFRAHEE